MRKEKNQGNDVTDIYCAAQRYVDVGDGISLWCQTWGTPRGAPVLFVHGGPGAAVAYYNNINAMFFEADKYYVVEVDQRGTGRSQPSVSEDYRHMCKYLNISIAQMAYDFEAVRTELGIDRWLVFGGSWGSTLALQYGEMFPDRCLGLILRGIYLNTVAEFDIVCARKPPGGDERRLKAFEIFCEPAAREAQRRGEPALDPCDTRRLIELYDKLHQAGDRNAIWKFFVSENNIIEEDSSKLMNPDVIDEKVYPMALSVSFFEARLFLKGTFEEPIDLLGGVSKLRGIPIWIAHGKGDVLCSEVFAEQLVDTLKSAGIAHTAYFPEAGHSAGSNGMTKCLQQCVKEWWAAHCDRK